MIHILIAEVLQYSPTRTCPGQQAALAASAAACGFATSDDGHTGQGFHCVSNHSPVTCYTSMTVTVKIKNSFI